MNYSGTKYAYIYNLQGDVLGLIDSTGEEVVRYTYDAWGKVLSTTGSLASTLGTLNPFRYRGYIYDTESLLYYLRSRFYSPNWQRFLNADSIIQGNHFSYCNDNPTVFCDVDGKSPTPSPTVPERDAILKRLGLYPSFEAPFESARKVFEQLNPGKKLADIFIHSSKAPQSSFYSSERTHNRTEKIMYDILSMSSDVSDNIGQMVEMILQSRGISMPISGYISSGLQIGAHIWSKHPPETHQYTTYTLKNEYFNSVKGYRYVSIQQEFSVCDNPNCSLHQSGTVKLSITVSNDVIPFYTGTNHTFVFQYTPQ